MAVTGSLPPLGADGDRLGSDPLVGNETRDDDWSVITGDLRLEALAPGSRVGDYVVLDELGRGGMGLVYTAYDPKLDRKIALKVLRPSFDPQELANAKARLLAEARALAKVRHPNVVAVHDVGTVDEQVYLAMELVDGSTLSEWREAERRTVSEILEVMVEVATGLAAVHEVGLVHRDVKPDNILIEESGRARVTDFGLARSLGDPSKSLREHERAVVKDVEAERLDLTRSGARLGTPAYMSREQLHGETVTAASDQYGLCVSFWEMLYGERPYGADNWASLVLEVTNGEIREPPAVDPPVPQWVRRVLERGLRPNPDERWPSLEALVEAIRVGDPDRARRRRWWLIGAGGVGLGAVAVASAMSSARHERALATCRAEGAEIDDKWGDAARRGVVDAFVATGRDGAEDTARAVTSVVDRFAEGWAEARESVCVESTVDHTLEPETAARMVDCLDEAASEMRSLVDVLQHADGVMVSRAQMSAESLEHLDRCHDTDYLARVPALPDDPELQAEVRSLRRELSGTLAHEHLGLYEEGLKRSRDALVRAEQTGHGPVIAHALYRVAVFEEKLGSYEEATEHWAAAFRRAAVEGQEQLAADAASALAFCEGYQLRRTHAGIRWAELAGVYTERTGMQDTLTEARRLDVLAVMLESLGDYDRAIATHREAIAIRRRHVPANHQSIGYGLANLAGVYETMGDLDRARELLVEAKAIFEESFGPDNPTTAHVLNNLANVERKRGDFAAARALLGRVLPIWEASVGPEHPDVGDVHNALADIDKDEGKLDAAVKEYERALAIHEAALKEHPDVASTAIRLAQVLILQGELPRARALLERSGRMLVDAKEEDMDRVGRVHHGLGDILLREGESERARHEFQRAQEAFASQPHPHGDWIARSRLGIAAAQVAEGAPENESAIATLTELCDDDKHSVEVQAMACAWKSRASGAAEDASRARALANDGPGWLPAEIDRLMQ